MFSYKKNHLTERNGLSPLMKFRIYATHFSLNILTTSWFFVFQAVYKWWIRRIFSNSQLVGCEATIQISDLSMLGFILNKTKYSQVLCEVLKNILTTEKCRVTVRTPASIRWTVSRIPIIHENETLSNEMSFNWFHHNRDIDMQLIREWKETDSILDRWVSIEIEAKVSKSTDLHIISCTYLAPFSKKLKQRHLINVVVQLLNIRLRVFHDKYFCCLPYVRKFIFLYLTICVSPRNDNSSSSSDNNAFYNTCLARLGKITYVISKKNIRVTNSRHKMHSLKKVLIVLYMLNFW